MTINLIESKRASQKPVRGTLVSVTVHAALITLAVIATASASEVHKPSGETIIAVFYHPTPEEKPAMPQAAPHESRSDHFQSPALPQLSPVVTPTEIPTSLPEIDPTKMFASREKLFTMGAGSVGTSSTVSGSAVSGSGNSYSASQVEKPALPRSGNPSPRYPTMLESSRIEGVVLAEFVVDTLGRADMSTFRVLESTNDLFTASLRTALESWRFFPAEAGGRKVKQVVQLPLKFIAPVR